MNNTQPNLIIMAAGFGSRMSPLTWTTPKPLIKMYNEILIERLINQAKTANLKEVIVVTGHLSEKFNYLQDMYGDFVKLVYNKYYDSHNNIMSVYVAKEHIKNSIISVGDVYYKQNPFYEDYGESIYWIKNSSNKTPTTSSNNLINDYSVKIENNYISSIVMEKMISKYSIYSMFYITNKETSSLLDILNEYYNNTIKNDNNDLKQYYISSLISSHITQFKFKPIFLDVANTHTANTLQELRELDASYCNDSNSILKQVSKTLNTNEYMMQSIQLYSLNYNSYHKHITFKFNGNKYLCKQLGYNMLPAYIIEKLIQNNTYHHYENLISSIGDTIRYLNKIHNEVEILPCTQLSYNSNYELHKFIQQDTEQIDLFSGVDTAFATIQNSKNAMEKLKDINHGLSTKQVDLSPIPTLLDRLKLFDNLVCAIYSLNNINEYDAKILDYKNLRDTVIKILSKKKNNLLLHCDLLNVNILNNNDQSILIDWEYAQLGYDINLDIFNQFIYYTDTTVEDIQKFCSELSIEYDQHYIYELIIVNLYKRMQYFIITDQLKAIEKIILNTLNLLKALTPCNI